MLLEAGCALHQQLLVDFREQLPDGHWDGWLAAGWERLAALHFPADGIVPAYRVARSNGASWPQACAWLAAQFINEEGGCPGFYTPGQGIHVYAPSTRPKSAGGSPFFAGQWSGPLAYLGHILDKPEVRDAADRSELLFHATIDPAHYAESIGTIGKNAALLLLVA